MNDVSKISSNIKSNLGSFLNHGQKIVDNSVNNLQKIPSEIVTSNVDLSEFVVSNEATKQVKKTMGSSKENIQKALSSYSQFVGATYSNSGLTLKDVMNNFNNYQKNAKDWWENTATPFFDNLKNNANQSLNNTGAKIKKGFKSVGNFILRIGEMEAETQMMQAKAYQEASPTIGATATTAALSVGEGVIKVGEWGCDAANIYTTLKNTRKTVVVDAFQFGKGLITGKEWNSLTAKMWDDTKNQVARDYTGDAFDFVYDKTKLGKWLKKETYKFDTTREIGKGVGEAVGITAISVVTFGAGGAAIGAGGATAGTAGSVTASQLGATASVIGFGKGAEKSWANGGSTLEGLATAGLTGIWEGFQWFVGAKINGLKVGNNKLLNSFARIGLDGIDGGAEGLVQPFIDSIYQKGYYNDKGSYIKFSDSFLERYTQMFEHEGGWKNVGQNAVIGVAMSTVGETFDLGDKFLKDKNNNLQMPNLNNNSKKNIETISREQFLKNDKRFVEITKIMNSKEYIEYMERAKNGYAQVLRPEFENLDIEWKNINDMYKKINSGELNIMGIKDEISQFETIKTFKTKEEISTFFNDSKQYLYSLAEKKFGNDWINQNLVIDVSTINEDRLFAVIKNYMSNDEMVKYTSILNSENNLQRLYTDFDKQVIDSYTKHSGPAITGYQRGIEMKFRDNKGGQITIDFTNLDSTNNYIKIVNDEMKRIRNNAPELDFNTIESTIEDIIEKSPSLPESIMVYRGADGLFSNGVELKDFKPGTVINDSAFVSTSVTRTNVATKHKYEIQIELPKGTKGAYLEAATGVNKYNQQEFLLGKNSKFEITSYPELSFDNNGKPHYILKAKLLNN